jgi:hypothetical protein
MAKSKRGHHALDGQLAATLSGRGRAEHKADAASEDQARSRVSVDAILLSAF